MTHKSGNILDLVFTDYQSKILVTNLKVSSFISDHECIVWQIGYEKSPISVSTNLLGIGKILILRNFVMDWTWIAWITPWMT